MPTLLKDLPDRIKSRPCEKCDEEISDEEDSILTFTGGNFVRLHDECADYMEHATKGLRYNAKSPDAGATE